MGQCRVRHRSGPPNGKRPAVRPVHAADHDRVGCQDGQERVRRSVAQQGHAQPYDYWQFWRNTDDGDVGKFMRLFTDLPEAEIARLEKLQGAELNDAKKVLATEATAVLHGREAANSASETARRTFEEGAFALGL